MNISDVSVYNMNLKISMFVYLRSEVVLENVLFKDITQNLDSVARVIRIESNSACLIKNVTFENINFSLIGLTDSSMQLYDTLVTNITAPRNVFE